MSTLWIAAFILAASPSEGNATAASAALGLNVEVPSDALRTGPELHRAVREALQHWARPSDAEADAAARVFLLLYTELQCDEEMAKLRRNGLLGKVRRRLLKLADQIAKRIARQKHQQKDAPPTALDHPSRADVVLAQQFGRGFAPGPIRGGGFGPQAVPGPGFGGRGFGPGGINRPAFGRPGFAGGADDHGEELVELIRRTIAPETWDVNGGPGTIYYWRPGRALVVRQMGHIHDHIGEVLDQLQRVSR